MLDFDPQQYLDAVTTEEGSTVSVPIPIGEYPATIEAVNFATGTIGKGDNIGKPWLRFEATWNLESEAVKAMLDKTKVTVRQSIMLDITESGAIDYGKGKNIRYNKLRDALGLNQRGEPFSPRMMVGRPAMIRVTQRPSDKDQAVIFNDVDAVTHLAA